MSRRLVLAGQRHADGRYIPAYRGIPWCSKTRENSQAVRLWKSSCHATLFRGENHEYSSGRNPATSPLVAGQVSCLRPHFMKIRFGAA